MREMLSFIDGGVPNITFWQREKKNGNMSLKFFLSQEGLNFLAHTWFYPNTCDLQDQLNICPFFPLQFKTYSLNPSHSYLFKLQSSAGMSQPWVAMSLAPSLLVIIHPSVILNHESLVALFQNIFKAKEILHLYLKKGSLPDKHKENILPNGLKKLKRHIIHWTKRESKYAHAAASSHTFQYCIAFKMNSMKCERLRFSKLTGDFSHTILLKFKEL